MSKVVLVVILVTGLFMIYLGIAATWCVMGDRSLARSSVVLRILISWFLPLLGPVVTIRVAAEESSEGLRSRWWLWPLRPLLSAGRARSRRRSSYGYASRRGADLAGEHIHSTALVNASGLLMAIRYEWRGDEVYYSTVF